VSVKEFGPDYYDRLYEERSRPAGAARIAAYLPLYDRVAAMLERYQPGTVLEVGCGDGVLAQRIIARGIAYQGFDFSPAAIEKAALRHPGGRFFVGDASDPAAYRGEYDAIVCCEVLEHIEADLSVIANWRPGCLCLCSVPNFGYESHVRSFASATAVERRYGGLLKIERIERIATPARAGLTWPEYFRRLRWARNEPKRLLGILGVNRFAWYGGWFLFAARRR
jgi:SAM-dependent methyltransferase